MSPRVSVLMAVYNGEKYLREAVDSILQQTFTDLEFIIVDDGSTDTSFEIIQSYHDPRIRLLRNEQNLGLSLSLNKGLDQARGEYIARMDCDDISLPERLTKQVALMDSDPKVGVCGTWAKDIDHTGKAIGERQRLVAERLEYYYWIPSPIIHPSAMIRSIILKNLRYDCQVEAEDFDLWLRVVGAKYKLCNLAEYQLLYRVHDESITEKNLDLLLSSSYGSFCRHVAPLNISYEVFLAFFLGSTELNPIRRALIMWRLAKAINKPYRIFLRDSNHYLKRWLQNYVYKVVSTSRIFKPIREVRRQIKSHMS